MLHGEKIRGRGEEHHPTLDECFLVWPAIKQVLTKYGKDRATFRLAGDIGPTTVEEDISTFDFETY